MAIKTRPRADVQRCFVDGYQMLALAAMKTIHTAAIRHPDGFRDTYLRRYKSQIARLGPIAKNMIGPGVGMDKEITRLRGLPYQSFTISKHNSRKYLVGVTQNIIMQAFDGSVNLQRYFMGAYFIYVPFSAFATGNLSEIHLIPEMDMFAVKRHPHHLGATILEHMSNVNLDAALQHQPISCWASVGPAIVGMLKAVDVVEAFRVLHMFLTRYDTGSPLAEIRTIKFAELI